jgi:hypothetical protein
MAKQNPARQTVVELLFRGRLRHFPAVVLDAGTVQPLWGITFRLLRNLRKTVNTTIDANIYLSGGTVAH